MRIKPKTVTRSVKVLRNPNPQYVSLVDHGSIQEPFTALKAAVKPNGAKPMPISRRQTSTKNADAPKKPGVGVRKIMFDKSIFADEETVAKYLTDNGYEGYAVKEEDNIFVVEGDLVDDDLEEVKAVKMEDGVTGYVGSLTEEGTQKRASYDDEDDEDEEDEEDNKFKKKKKSVLKFDYFTMHMSEADSVKSVLADGMSDGVPPGVMDIVQASAYAIGNVLSGDSGERASKLGAIGREMSSLIAKVSEIYDALPKAKKSENVVAFKAAYEAFLADAKAKKIYMPAMTGTPTSYPHPVDATPSAPNKSLTSPAPASAKYPHNEDATPSAPATTGSPVTARPSAPPTEYPRPGEAAPSKAADAQTVAEGQQAANDAMVNRISEMLGLSLVKAMEPINAKLADLTEKVESASTAATSAVEQVEKMAARVPTKKAAVESTDKPAAATKDTARKTEGIRNFASAVGLSR